MKGTKSRRVIFGHTNGVVFLLQGHYLQGLKIGSKTWCTSKMRGKRYSDTWSSGYGFVARVKWMMLQSSTKTLKKKGGKFGGYSEFLGFSDFLSFTRLHFCGPPRFVEGVEIQKNRSCAAHRLQISRRSAYHHPNHPTVCWVFECFLRDVCHTWFGEDFPKKTTSLVLRWIWLFVCWCDFFVHLWMFLSWL